VATANIELIGSGSLAAGATTTKTWKNPPLGNVLGFWVQPRKLASEEILVGPAAFQIVSVVTKMDLPNHFVVEVQVKNVGSVDFGFELFLSWLS
jgi:hypothetical protein